MLTALFSITKHGVTPNAHEMIDKQKVVQTMEYLFGHRNDEVMIQSTTWKGPENTLSERSRTEKAT